VQQIARLWIHVASSPHPKASLLRVDIRDAAIAGSGVTTLDRVAVSDKKMKMIYIKWGKVGPVRLGNSAAPDNKSEG
jgi:hypothetical protein